MNSTSQSLSGPHRFAIFLACCVIFLISAGGLVKSLEAGLSAGLKGDAEWRDTFRISLTSSTFLLVLPFKPLSNGLFLRAMP